MQKLTKNKTPKDPNPKKSDYHAHDGLGSQLRYGGSRGVSLWTLCCRSVTPV